ncbi:LPS export ABC transporter permease LptF [Acidicapsa dinghuensis]|uniref:LPS export ABC transporter permease LptF n=1 Tax=Acidicapsa dinghuensis TaxID=2218256 RepID=A0ABW1EKX0_9BACT|nr:LPS export ABC transporter permease LptF [Acidicapsa dinghuensis]
MRILTRYILGEITSHALIGCALFTFILLMKPLEEVLDMVVRNSSSAAVVLEFFVYNLPNTFLVTIPMAVLVGVLLGLSRLAADSEITAMRASGFGIWYFVRVGSVVAILGTALGLVNSLLIEPAANQGILDLRKALETSQGSFEIQPRVFYEDFKNTVVYVQNVRSTAGVASWGKLFIADVTDPSAPAITTAASATVVSNPDQGMMIRLRDASEQQMSPNDPGQYNVSTYDVTDRPLTFSPQSEVSIGRLDTPLFALSNSQLLAMSHGADGKRYLIELHRRFAYPAACIVLMLIGVPLGAASRRGGKSGGFVVALCVVLVYYLLSNVGLAWAKQGRLPAFAGVWLANIVFAVVGVFLLSQLASGGTVLSAVSALWTRPRKPAQEDEIAEADQPVQPARSKAMVQERYRRRYSKPLTLQRFKPRGFPLILDEYVLREFLKMFSLILAGFVLMMLVFTFFELMGDILRNHPPLMTVGDYLVNLAPSMIYQITPLSVLIGVLVTFGLLNRSSELIAMKATGISIYRLVIPVLVIAVVLACALFAFDQYYLPQANRRQEALRNIIKGRPAQTTLNPDQKWIFGQHHPGEPDHIFYYQFFDRYQNAFANISVFEFDPKSFHLTKRIFASRAVWNDAQRTWSFEKGWERTIDGATVTGFHEFQQATFEEINEQPNYFEKESLQSQEMNFSQLQRYISDLQQSGFDTMRLKVQLYHKLAYPLVTVVMAVLAIPFALMMSRRGSLTGVAWAVGIAIAYWGLAGLFDAMGNVNYLPSAMAAWSPDLLFGLTGGYLLLRTPT